MQAIENNGFERLITAFDSEELECLLEDPKVKEVRVFKLRKGMVVNISGALHKVVAVRPNGKVTLKPKS